MVQKRTYTKRHYRSSDGMMTAVWGPGLWHYLHTMSFNYPVSPTPAEKKHYSSFVKSLQNVLPCRACRVNLKRNLSQCPITKKDMASRDSFSKYVYRLHETVNKMLGKKSGLTYCDVRDTYEAFRARCPKRKTRRESGCTEPLAGRRSRCVLSIIPHERRCKSLHIDKECMPRKNRNSTRRK